MEYQLKRLDVAADQVDWAIRLFLDQQAYAPAITLAGAACGLLEKPLGTKSIMYRLKEVIKENFVGYDDIDLNQGRNLLKHWDNAPDAAIPMELEKQAVYYIRRALMSFSHDYKQEPSEASRFWAWWLLESKRILPTEEQIAPVRRKRA